MNLRGAYTLLRENAIAALFAAIEIYNKPMMIYRDECMSILLVNAWELLLKAILSKNKQRIYYPKQRGQPYRTLSIQDALNLAKDYFPSDIPYEPVARNISILVTYRNNAIHFYNQHGFSVVIYGLAQTSIVNFRDMVLAIFGIDIVDKMTISLLPLSLGTQLDPVEFLKDAQANPPRNKEVAQFLRELSNMTAEIEALNVDTTRFLTVFKVNLQLVKKISSADIISGLTTAKDQADAQVVIRRVDPNLSHPLLQKHMLQQIGSTLKGVKFTSYTFQAIVWKYSIKEKSHLCWQPAVNGSPQYSNEVLSFIKNLSKNEIESSLNDFREYRRNVRTAEGWKRNCQ